LRLALGASQRQIVSRFLLTGLGVSLAGCLAGLCLAGALGQLLSSMLFGVSASDAKTLLSVVLLIGAATTLAWLLPALRAARVDPMPVLRDE
jgi:ABC-type antimicrobial peptide transport system permease subunit